MSPNSYNTRLVTHLLDAIGDFDAGKVSINEIHVKLQSVLPLVENDGSGIIDALRSAEVSIEDIRFTVLEDEQHSAMSFRLNELRVAIEAVVGA